MKLEAMMTECSFCKGRVVQQKVKVDFRWGRKLKMIENVPGASASSVEKNTFSPLSTRQWRNLQHLEQSLRRA